REAGSSKRVTARPKRPGTPAIATAKSGSVAKRSQPLLTMRRTGQGDPAGAYYREAAVRAAAAARLLDCCADDDGPDELEAQALLLGEQAGRQIEVGAALVRRSHVRIVG